ncbi:MAG: winged helix-turn-helix domain-containing protein [Gemmatimonadetes bacterium]|nr:winged helix-turn-helix domain-containing protein [Gemmatimonadota bacterium]
MRSGTCRVELSPREFRLLEHFMLHPEQVVTRVQLLQQVWDMSFDPKTNMIDAHISNLRKKLERYGRDPRLLQTIRGAGYALRLGDE